MLATPVPHTTHHGIIRQTSLYHTADITRHHYTIHQTSLYRTPQTQLTYIPILGLFLWITELRRMLEDGARSVHLVYDTERLVYEELMSGV